MSSSAGSTGSSGTVDAMAAAFLFEAMAGCNGLGALLFRLPSPEELCPCPLRMTWMMMLGWRLTVEMDQGRQGQFQSRVTRSAKEFRERPIAGPSGCFA